MFQSERLQEKWNHFSTMKVLIQSKILTVVCEPSPVENQEKFLKEEAGFSSGINLMETPNMNTNSGSSSAGFSADATAAGPVAGFDPVLISLIRRAFNLVIMTWLVFNQ